MKKVSCYILYVIILHSVSFSQVEDSIEHIRYNVSYRNTQIEAITALFIQNVGVSSDLDFAQLPYSSQLSLGLRIGVERKWVQDFNLGGSNKIDGSPFTLYHFLTRLTNVKDNFRLDFVLGYAYIVGVKDPTSRFKDKGALNIDFQFSWKLLRSPIFFILRFGLIGGGIGFVARF